MFRGVRPVLTALAVSGGILATVTGCAARGTPYHRPSSSAAASAVGTAPTVAASPLPTASMTPLPAASGQLTGTQLASALLPASFFPAGFTAPSSGPVTSGGSLTSAAARYDLATLSCAGFLHDFGGTGFGETAMAAGTFTGTGQVYDELVYQFRTAGAAASFMTGVRGLAARCGSFTATDNGTAGRFTMTAAAGPAIGGHPTLDVTQRGNPGGSKLVIETRLSASGVDVFAAAAVGIGGGAPAVPASETIIYDLMKRQAAAALLS